MTKAPFDELHRYVTVPAQDSKSCTLDLQTKWELHI